MRASDNLPKCGAQALGMTCDREAGHTGQHRGYNEQIDEPMFWPALSVRNEVVPAQPFGWLAARPNPDGTYTLLGGSTDKGIVVAQCTEPEDFIVPAAYPGATVVLDQDGPEAEHPLRKAKSGCIHCGCTIPNHSASCQDRVQR